MLLPRFSRPPHDVLQVFAAYLCTAAKYLAGVHTPSSASKPLLCQLVPSMVTLGVFKEDDLAGVEHILRNVYVQRLEIAQCL